jgi:hypothetical protein
MQPTDVFAKCFQGSQAGEEIACIKAYGLFDSWEAPLLAYCQSLPGSGTKQKDAAYEQLMLSCLRPLLRQKEGCPPLTDSVSDCSCLAKAAALLLNYTRQLSGITKGVFTTLFLKTIKHCCKQPTDKLMLGDLIHELILMNLLYKAEPPESSPPADNKNRTISLRWNPQPEDKGDQLTFFSDAVCKQFPGVKSPKSIIILCSNQEDKRKLTIPHRYLCPFLALFDLMVLYGRISCEGNHGLILFLSRYIVAPEDEEEYNTRVFRLQKSRALAHKGHKLIIKKMVKDIFFRFCTGDKAEKIFEKYFR